MSSFWSDLGQSISNKISEGVQTVSDASSLPHVEPADPPWVLMAARHRPLQVQLRRQILMISTEKYNFLTTPSVVGLEDVMATFHFDMDAYEPVALACLREDKNLRTMCSMLIPDRISTDTFWKNYFMRVHLLKATILSADMDSCMAHPGEVELIAYDRDELCKRIQQEMEGVSPPPVFVPTRTTSLNLQISSTSVASPSAKVQQPGQFRTMSAQSSDSTTLQSRSGANATFRHSSNSSGDVTPSSSFAAVKAREALVDAEQSQNTSFERKRQSRKSGIVSSSPSRSRRDKDPVSSQDSPGGDVAYPTPVAEGEGQEGPDATVASARIMEGMRGFGQRLSTGWGGWRGFGRATEEKEPEKKSADDESANASAMATTINPLSALPNEGEAQSDVKSPSPSSLLTPLAPVTTDATPPTTDVKSTDPTSAKATMLVPTPAPAPVSAPVPTEDDATDSEQLMKELEDEINAELERTLGAVGSGGGDDVDLDDLDLDDFDIDENLVDQILAGDI
eukprot:TRINITY_DN3189_c0_g2_i1.p1 TRINITY_DN3189_c0_g2~~TRINITY_DN3189_c0_g2_i1.p1  ORF type:complete len:509 (+),score=87.99 TRINITY_DN3189_c0_g2_i1:82-1608(+)